MHYRLKIVAVLLSIIPAHLQAQTLFPVVDSTAYVSADSADVYFGYTYTGASSTFVPIGINNIVTPAP